MTFKVLFNLIPLALKQLIRHRIRTLLTLLGIGAGIFLFTLVESMQSAVSEITGDQASEVTLVVFRENRYCPSTSRLPEYYADEIRQVDGVREVIPIQITVNNCGASLDVVTFRGVPPEQFTRYASAIEITSGALTDWQTTDDGALVGENLALRRGLKPGDSFAAAGLRVRVSGILRSDNAQDNNVAYVHLRFLQQASRKGLGEVTQFNVRVDDPARLAQTAKAIDARFRSGESPTFTQPESAFFAQAAGELISLTAFTRWIGLGAVIAVLGLVANAVLLVVRTRVQENAVLQTLGYPDRAIAWLVLLEGLLLGLAGGLAGAGAAWLFLHFSHLSFGNEGQIMAVSARLSLVMRGMGIAFLLGGLAALYPAWVSVRRPIVESLRG
jgi:putative ABC transport system permease protein